MPKKQQQRNPFFFFMLDWKAQEEKAGRSFPNGLKDVQADPGCNDAWRNLTPQEKIPYTNRAKDSKVQFRGNVGKLTSSGELQSAVEQEARRQQEFEDRMNEYIKNVTSIAARNNNLHTLRFYFIHVNWFCRQPLPNNRSKYLPAEFAIGEFSLEHGIRNIYHEIIKVDIPLGYTREAREHSADSHQIPINLEYANGDFFDMYKKFIKVLQPEMSATHKPPPLYTMKSNVPGAMDLLKFMSHAAEREGLIENAEDMFLVYSLENLFMNIRNSAPNNLGTSVFPFEVLAENELKKDPFAYTQNLECSFHKNLDGTSLHCSMSVIKRWAYTIIDQCCIDFKIELIPGNHCPLSLKVDRLKKLNETINSNLDESIQESIQSLSTLSMTGVSEEHRRQASERTYAEEQARRNQPRTLSIIDHSKKNQAAEVKPPVEAPVPKTTRPLRTPKTTSMAVKASNVVPDVNDKNSFPSIGGRGMALKQKLLEHQSTVGRGGSS